MTGEFEPGTLGALMVLPVVISSIVPGLFAGLAGLGVQKFTPASAARNFAILAGAFGLLSLMGPANVKQISTSTIVVMELMHVIAGVGIGGMVFRTLKRG